MLIFGYKVSCTQYKGRVIVRFISICVELSYSNEKDYLIQVFDYDLLGNYGQKSTIWIEVEGLGDFSGRDDDLVDAAG